MKKNHRKEKIKRNIKDRTNLILFLLFVCFTLSFTVGYAVLNSEINISGEATFRVEEDIRITNVNLFETTNLGLENYTNKYGKDSITLGVSLPNIESSVTYKVEITNSGTVSMWIDSINQEINNNTNMEYKLDGIGVKELINPGDKKEFNITIKYKDNISLPSNTNLDTMLRFNFIKPTSTLAQGTTGASTTTFFNSGPIMKESVETINFAPTLEVGENAIGYWDASYNKDGTVIAWYTDNDSNNLYELTIGCIGKVYTPSYSTALFMNFKKLTLINFNGYLDTSRASYMSSIFRGCNLLEKIDISDWNTSNASEMSSMFWGCNSLVEADVSNFSTSKVKSINLMFSGCNSLEKIDVSKWNTKNISNASAAFASCNKLTSLNVSNWDTSNLTNTNLMFSGCNLLEEIDVSKWNTSKVTNMGSMFYNCKSLTSLNLSSFDTSKVTDMSSMFYGCSSLLNLDVSSFDTSNVLSMKFMFCSVGLESLDLNNFSTTNVTDFSYMFQDAGKLKTLNISSFEIQNAELINSMFAHCTSLTELDLRNFGTNKIDKFSSMFYDCSSLQTLDLSNLSTSNATSLNNMFQDCKSLTSLDLSSFDTTNVTNMTQMFEATTKLVSLNISGFDFSNVSSYSYMFNALNANALILVKDQAAYDFVIGARSNLSNVQIINL